MKTPARHSASVRLRTFFNTYVAGAFAASLIVAGVVIPAAPATAVEIPDAITSVSVEKESYGYKEKITLNFTWSVPDKAVTGDTFSLRLPPELKADNRAKFPLLAPDGSVVANAAWNDTTVTFTLTDYVDDHDDVGGSGFVSVRWDHSEVPETSAPITLVFEGAVIVVEIEDKPTPPTPPAPCNEDCPAPAPTPTDRGLHKSGGWTDGSYQGTRDDDHNLYWSITLPGNPEGYTGPITVLDTLAVGSIIECETIRLTTQITLEKSAEKSPVDPSRYSLDCAATAFTLVLDAIAPDEFMAISYKGTITDQLAGTYSNRVKVSAPSGESDVKERDVKRTAGGGFGNGTQSVSVGDYVWLDTNRDGLQDENEQGIPGVTLRLTGPDGDSVSDISGKPVGPTATNEDGWYTFDNLPVLTAGQHYTVWIDQEASEEVLNMLLPTVPAAGSDRGKDSSTDFAESTGLTTNGARDNTLDFGFITYELPTLPPPTSETAELAFTGSDTAAPLLIGALALTLLGAASLILVRLRRG